MRQRSIRSTHWSGHPDHPREGGDGQFVLRVLTGKTTRPNRTNLAPQESPESPQHSATLTATQTDVADQPEGWQCNAGVRKRNADGTRCETQRNATPDSDATNNRSCGPRSRHNTIATSTSICGLQLGGRHVACRTRMTHPVHSRKVRGTSRHSIPKRASRSGGEIQCEPLVPSRRVSATTPLPRIPVDGRTLVAFHLDAWAKAVSSVSAVGAAHSGHLSRAWMACGVRTARTGLPDRRFAHFVFTPVAGLDDGGGVAAVDRATKSSTVSADAIAAAQVVRPCAGRISARVDASLSC